MEDKENNDWQELLNLNDEKIKEMENLKDIIKKETGISVYQLDFLFSFDLETEKIREMRDFILILVAMKATKDDIQGFLRDCHKKIVEDI